MKGVPLTEELYKYITDTFIQEDELLKQIVADTEAKNIPLIQVSPETGKLLGMFVKMISAKNVLEIGTLTGYSTIWMARALPPDGKVTTLELTKVHADEALSNYKKAGLDNMITLKLGKAAEKHGMKIGYHGHEQQTFTLWDTALAQSPANAMNLDFGHFVAAGNPNPLDIIKQKHDRIVSMHIKDRKTKANGGDNLPWGTGDTPIADALRLMRDSKYTFPATIELEYKIPEGSTSIAEVKKCLEFCKTALG